MGRCLLLGALVALLAGGTSLGDELPQAFTLGKYVPDDACLYFHSVHNPQRDFIAKHWERVFAAIAASGIDTEIKNHITRRMGDERVLR